MELVGVFNNIKRGKLRNIKNMKINLIFFGNKDLQE